MSKEEISTISEQRNQVFHGDGVELDSPCSIGGGIVHVSDALAEEAVSAFQAYDGSVSFFVPASGSGSRMFKVLNEYLKSSTHSKESREFFDRIDDFAFVNKLPLRVREKIGGTEESSIAAYILSEEGMGYNTLPKGLIPFHRDGSSVLNPFQTQYRQLSELIKNKGVIHFTVQGKFQAAIEKSISEVSKSHVELEFSQQSPLTDAFCFDKDEKPILEAGEYLRRPAGHGALLDNLNAVDSDLILIKNIDNIQPTGKDVDSKLYCKVLGGFLLNFKKELLALSKDFNTAGLIDLNEKYQFLKSDLVESITLEDINGFLIRPTRVCGMVKNEGEPGGGPFWVKEKNGVSKQIVELSQIDASPEQKSIVTGSSHFNPVFIAVSSKDAFGEKLDLRDFVDESKCMTVVKPHKGKSVYYRELPGLWNGSMANWNTIFIEIPSTTFSPVKSVLNLLRPPHI